ncbi:amidohydrolase family protein [Acidicapsa acidisoli]|uniref:amidohydrolase family protein n=1 Tax=Acidicapsa acidisoli TaxID=1615681 RepID=UPI0021DFC0CF|nr:amidohydrolase family protein [Acidicapsa acidisoli]
MRIRPSLSLILSLTVLSLVVLGLTSAAFAQSSSAPAGRTLIRAGHLLDVHTGKLLDSQTIIVTGDRITAISSTASTPASTGDTVIDLGSLTVLPGLIDVHTHITGNPDFDPYRELTGTDAKDAINGVVNARTTLMAGFTTIRNVGASGYVDVDLRDAINAGQVPGPHMQVSGPPLGITGGHCDENLLPIRYHLTGDGVADGIAAVQQKVRQNIKYGVDVIKICATGGVLSKGDSLQASQYTLEEMKAIAADAHRLGLKVAAHAHGAQGILWASEAGIDSIEHGSFIDAAGIAEMKKDGTYLVPTLYLEDWMMESGHLPVFYQQKMKDAIAVAKPNIRRAYEAGVKIALGTDAAVYPHGLNAHEVEVYVRDLGMTPLAAIQSATLNGADLMGWTDRAGSLDAGKWADIIAVDGNPLADVKLLQDVKFVMKAGVVYKGTGAK